VFVYRDTAAVVGDRCPAVAGHADPDVFSKTGDGFVDGVVDDLGNQVVEAFFIGGADVHAGTFSYRLKSFENGDVFGGVFRCIFDHRRVRLYLSRESYLMSILAEKLLSG